VVQQWYSSDTAVVQQWCGSGAAVVLYYRDINSRMTCTALVLLRRRRNAEI